MWGQFNMQRFNPAGKVGIVTISLVSRSMDECFGAFSQIYLALGAY